MTDHPDPPPSPALDMRAFFPYRLAVLSEAVSHAVAEIYQERFDLTRNAWRLLAALANLPASTATELGTYSTLDKMQVSRALTDLEQRGLVRRAAGRADRRTKRVELTRKGRARFEAMIPHVRAREEAILSVLTTEQREALQQAFAALEQAAQLYAVRR